MESLGCHQLGRKCIRLICDWPIIRLLHSLGKAASFHQPGDPARVTSSVPLAQRRLTLPQLSRIVCVLTNSFLTSFYSSHLIRKRGLVKVGGRSASGGGCVYVSPQPLRGLPSEALKAERLSLLDSDCFWRIDPSPRAPEVNLNPISPNQGSSNP